jgi:hypothetical protein
LTGICLYAACSCHEITEWKRPGQLLEHGALIEQLNAAEQSPIALAAAAGHAGCLAVLLGAGANPEPAVRTLMPAGRSGVRVGEDHSSFGRLAACRALVGEHARARVLLRPQRYTRPLPAIGRDPLGAEPLGGGAAPAAAAAAGRAGSASSARAAAVSAPRPVGWALRNAAAGGPLGAPEGSASAAPSASQVTTKSARKQVRQLSRD